MTFSGKVVLITGASSDIGTATGVYFATLGASLALTSINEDSLNMVASECKKADCPELLTITADVTKESDVERIISETIGTFGKINVLVNNAGILEFGSIENTSLSQFDRVFNTNVRSVYQLTKLAVPHLITTKGSIVNVSSVAGTQSFPRILAYCMSKSAVDQFTSCVALELAPHGVRVNSVNPGIMVTEIHRRGGMDEHSYQEFLERYKQTCALGRAGGGREVAAAIAFLASDEASFITGEHLHIDGGSHPMCPK